MGNRIFDDREPVAVLEVIGVRLVSQKNSADLSPPLPCSSPQRDILSAVTIIGQTWILFQKRADTVNIVEVDCGLDIVGCTRMQQEIDDLSPLPDRSDSIRNLRSCPFQGCLDRTRIASRQVRLTPEDGLHNVRVACQMKWSELVVGSGVHIRSLFEEEDHNLEMTAISRYMQGSLRVCVTCRDSRRVLGNQRLHCLKVTFGGGIMDSTAKGNWASDDTEEH